MSYALLSSQFYSESVFVSSFANRNSRTKLRPFVKCLIILRNICHPERPLMKAKRSRQINDDEKKTCKTPRGRRIKNFLIVCHARNQQ